MIAPLDKSKLHVHVQVHTQEENVIQAFGSIERGRRLSITARSPLGSVYSLRLVYVDRL